jgi:hypothetical protein
MLPGKRRSIDERYEHQPGPNGIIALLDIRVFLHGSCEVQVP